MRKILFSLLCLSLLAHSSCKEKEPGYIPEPLGGSVTVKVAHLVNGEKAEFGVMKYINANGDSIQVDLLNHFISNFSFHEKNGSWKKIDFYRLVRHADSLSQSFTLNGLAFAEYDSIRFFIGLDTFANHSLEQLTQIDPGYSMIWTWNTGYIFYMFEGKFINKNGNTLGFAYHIGGDNYLMEYSLPIDRIFSLSSSKTEEHLTVNLDLAGIFRSPNLIDLNNVPLVSHTFDQPALTAQLRDNILNAVSIE